MADFDEVEVVETHTSSTPARKSSKAPPKPPARPKQQVVEDFEEVADFDDLGGAGYDDKYGDYDDGYEDGPTVRRPRKRRKGSNRPGGYTSVHDDQRDRHNSPYNSRTDDRPQSLEGQVWNGSVIGGLAAMIIAVVWFFGALAAGWFFPYTIILFFIGLVGFVRGLMD